MMFTHIINGDSTAQLLTACGIQGEQIVWRDVLHGGPIVSFKDSNYDEIRSNYLANLSTHEKDNTNSYDSILASFQHRQAQMAKLNNNSHIILWFEHDLYDQLQLLEVLHQLESRFDSFRSVSIVSIDSHNEVEFFHGFGNLNPTQFAPLIEDRKPLTRSDCLFACHLWEQIIAADPRPLTKTAWKHSNFPYLPDAMLRYCQEFPDNKMGLTLTQYRLLLAIKQPATTLSYYKHIIGLDSENPTKKSITSYEKTLKSVGSFKRLFLQMYDEEAAPFMGDLWIEHELCNLMDSNLPLIECKNPHDAPFDRIYHLLPAADKVLSGKYHWLKNNNIEIYRGGVHICSTTPWCWNNETNQFELIKCTH